MTKKIGLVAFAVIAIIAVVGVVSAQATTPEPTTPQAQQATPMPSTAGRGIFGQLLQIVATDLDMQPQDLLQQLRGQTLAQVIQSKNGDVTKITADINAA